MACTPRATAGLYQLTTPLSELASSMLGLYGGVIAMGGVYLAALAAGLTQPRCLAAVLLANGFIALKWTAMEASKLKLNNMFKCPVYVTQDRRNAMGKDLVFEADLATDQHVSHWVLQGVALVLNID